MECEICSTEDNLEEHHIDADRDNNSEDNLIILCSSCHRQVHHESALDHLKDEEILALKDELPVMTQYEITCQHCEYTWQTASEMQRVTCPSCNNKTKRNQEGDS